MVNDAVNKALNSNVINDITTRTMSPSSQHVSNGFKKKYSDEELPLVLSVERYKHPNENSSPKRTIRD